MLAHINNRCSSLLDTSDVVLIVNKFHEKTENNT